MIRVVLQNVLLFLLPTLVYIAYRMLTSRGPGSFRRAIDNAPFGWLLTAGVAIVFVFIAFFAASTGGRPGDVYIPPYMKDGKIVEGHFEPTAPAPPAPADAGAPSDVTPPAAPATPKR